MNKIILFLMLLILSVANIAPISHAMDAPNKENNQTSFIIHTETLDKENAEEKILFCILFNSSSEVARSGHLLNDIFAVPPERFYLPDEPPTV